MGGIITITLPNYTSGFYAGLTYTQLPNSNPPATCSATPSGSKLHFNLIIH